MNGHLISQEHIKTRVGKKKKKKRRELKRKENISVKEERWACSNITSLTAIVSTTRALVSVEQVKHYTEPEESPFYRVEYNDFIVTMTTWVCL